MKLRSLMAGVALVLAVSVATAVLAPWQQRGKAPPATGARPSRTVSFSPSAALSGRREQRNIIARARHGTLVIYGRVGAQRRRQTLHPRTVAGHRIPIIVAVITQRRGWLHVRLPTRPNLSTGWIRRADVALFATSLRITVQLTAHRLLLRDRGRTLLHTRIAVGRSLSPTPTGEYFVTDLLRPPNPGGFYGPYALGLSAYSPVYTTFAGGDGQVGLHGTNDPSTLGHDVSHGCIRLSNTAITQLARTVPLGTPVTIQR